MSDWTWGLVLLTCGVVGGVGTAVLLRRGASRRVSEMEALVSDGSITWGAQVRERVDGRWGFSGRLIGTATTLKFEPDQASAKRGARVVTWALETTHLDLGPTQRDITGITYQMLSVKCAETSCQFGCAKMVGTGPEQSSG